MRSGRPGEEVIAGRLGAEGLTFNGPEPLQRREPPDRMAGGLSLADTCDDDELQVGLSYGVRTSFFFRVIVPEPSTASTVST